ncbi:MAG: hypothetical protein IPL96_01830 [Holophagaceae bacterium]|nr:hypothetical protein [Holophagaceae bacterium]
MLPAFLALALLQAAEPSLDPALAAKKVVRRTDHALADLTGDFDGDGKPDRAVAVKLAKGKDRGVLVVWGSSRPPVLLGAASDFNHFRDHDFDQWEVRKAKGPKKADAMVWIWSEKASARIVWNGKAFRWIQEGD